MSICTNRKVVTDSSGNLWDLGNPNILAIFSDAGGASTVLQLNGNQLVITVAFSVASAAFEAT